MSVFGGGGGGEEGGGGGGVIGVKIKVTGSSLVLFSSSSSFALANVSIYL